MEMQYVNVLYNVFKHQFRDMNTESLAPGIQNASANIIMIISDWYECERVSLTHWS